MEAKKYLRQVSSARKKIKNKLIEAQQWKDIALSITSYMGGERVQASSPKDKLAIAMAECEEAEGEVLEKVKDFRAVINDVTNTIESMENATEYDVLHQVFIQDKTLQDVADEYGYDYGWATTTQGRALKGVQQILERREHESNPG